MDTNFVAVFSHCFESDGFFLGAAFVRVDNAAQAGSAFYLAAGNDILRVIVAQGPA